MMLTAGLGGAARHGCVALADREGFVAVCEQERVTRVRGAGFNTSGLPDEALDVLLDRCGRSRADVSRYVTTDAGHDGFEHIDRHHALACTSYLSSPFDDACVVVCDHHLPKVSVWEGRDAALWNVEWPWTGPGFADVFSTCAAAFGFGASGGDQRFAALARLRPDHHDEDGLGQLLRYDAASLIVDARLESEIERALSGEPVGGRKSAGIAAALQARLTELFLDFLREVRRRTNCTRVCLSGSLFYQSFINTAARSANIFAEVFIPVDPGHSGLAVGAALAASGHRKTPLSPFLGPRYSPDETKQTLDNCKLQYTWESVDGAIDKAVSALRKGSLVGWFDGAMEWGPRALGARCILANPTSPYVLENLNRFLKQREPWRGYALSALEDAMPRHFTGPAAAPFMECDYRPRDAGRLRHILPSPEAAIRVQTVTKSAPPRFMRLLEAFESATTLPFLVNTSFNGFHEPIVCSPRDAVRVFYGSGLDVLVIDQFVLTK
jgi:carbamoyltransferase